LWFRTLDASDLEERKMPRDMATRWNFTYDMLEFAVRYRSAVDDITGDKSANLRKYKLEFAVRYRSAVDDITGDKSANLHKYELDDDEWRITVQLQNTLKVR
jgi:hypothetical protein